MPTERLATSGSTAIAVPAAGRIHGAEHPVEVVVNGQDAAVASHVHPASLKAGVGHQPTDAAERLKEPHENAGTQHSEDSLGVRAHGVAVQLRLAIVHARLAIARRSTSHAA